MPTALPSDVARMRELFFDGEARGRRLSRFWLLLSLASVIATAGVISDSTATVIGAMIVAPLMVPILGCVVAVAIADRPNLVRCAGLVVAGAAAVVLIAWLIGHAVATPITAATNSQVASRVAPRLIDLVAALATGAVGAIALAREDISDTLPGVAIAISLVPPLAVVGLTLDSGEPHQAFGALLLFATNVCAILATGILVMAIYRVHRHHADVADTEVKALNRRRSAITIVIGLCVIAVPLTLTSIRIASNTSTESTVTDVATKWAARADWDVATVNVRPDSVVIRLTGPEPEPDTATLDDDLKDAGLDDLTVRLELIPSQSVELGPR